MTDNEIRLHALESIINLLSRHRVWMSKNSFYLSFISHLREIKYNQHYGLLYNYINLINGYMSVIYLDSPSGYVFTSQVRKMVTSLINEIKLQTGA